MDRRPAEVPHHPKVLAIGAIVAAAALLFMGAWFWQVMTSPGLILTEEKVEQADDTPDELSSDRDRQAESAQQGEAGNSDNKGGPPDAPDENQLVANGLELSEYSILSENGILQVGGTVTNTSNQPMTGTVKVYAYVDAIPVATAKTEIENLQPGASESVNLVSDSEWEAGEKVILLAFDPARTTGNP